MISSVYLMKGCIESLQFSWMPAVYG